MQQKLFKEWNYPQNRLTDFFQELDEKLDAIGVGRIVDGVGRGVALDRDKNYDKVKRAYDAMVDGAGTRYE